MMHLKKYFIDGTVIYKGKLITGTVEGDLHDIGKNLVSIIAEGNGYEIIDLGIDVQAGKFIEALQSHPTTFVEMSALLTTVKINQTIKEAFTDVVTFVGDAP